MTVRPRQSDTRPKRECHWPGLRRFGRASLPLQKITLANKSADKNHLKCAVNNRQPCRSLGESCRRVMGGDLNDPRLGGLHPHMAGPSGKQDMGSFIPARTNIAAA